MRPLLADRSKAARTSRPRCFTTSGSGLFGNVGQVNYVAAKAAIATLCRSASAELKRYDVAVNVIGPVARTRMNENLERYKKPIEPVEFDALDPDNVSPLIVWLGSDDCDVTGEIFEMTGGRLGVFEADAEAISRTRSRGRGRDRPADASARRER